MTPIYGFTLVEIVLMTFATGSVVVGLFIGYQAYRGLRRHDSRQMLFLSVGVILLFGAAYALAFAVSILLQFRVLPLLYQDLLRVTVRILQFTGLVFIAYSMYMDG